MRRISGFSLSKHNSTACRAGAKDSSARAMRASVAEYAIKVSQLSGEPTSAASKANTASRKFPRSTSNNARNLQTSAAEGLNCKTLSVNAKAASSSCKIRSVRIYAQTRSAAVKIGSSPAISASTICRWEVGMVSNA